MANGKTVKLHLWKEGKNVIVRSDALHITTYGKSTKQALDNFKEAFALALESLSEKALGKGKALPFELELRQGSSYGRQTTKNKAAPAC